MEPGTRLFLKAEQSISKFTSRRVLYGDAKRAPFTELSRLFDVLLNVPYLARINEINYFWVGMASSQDSDLGSELNNGYA